MGLTLGKECPHCRRSFGAKTLGYHMENCTKRIKAPSPGRRVLGATPDKTRAATERDTRKEESPRFKGQKAVIGEKKFSFGPGEKDKHTRFSFGRKDKGVVSSAVPKPFDVAEIQTITEPIQRSRRLGRGKDLQNRNNKNTIFSKFEEKSLDKRAKGSIPRKGK